MRQILDSLLTEERVTWDNGDVVLVMDTVIPWTENTSNKEVVSEMEIKRTFACNLNDIFEIFGIHYEE